MLAITMGAAPRIASGGPKWKSFLAWLRAGVDAHADARMRRLVPQANLCRAQREIEKYRRLMQSDHVYPDETPVSQATLPLAA